MQIIGHLVIRLQDVDSTNNYAANLILDAKPPEGTAILAHNQFGGRGQRGSVWQVEPGANLTLSVVLYPRKVNVASQFIISKMVAVALADCVDEITGQNSQIKWPNDILLNGKKVAGILIETGVSGNYLSHSIIGMGLNVNQRNFEGLPNASSLSIEGNQTFDKEKVMGKLLSLLNYYYQVLQRGNEQKISSLYLEKLWRLEESAFFRIDGEVKKGLITGVKENGLLQVMLTEGQREFGNKEIEFVY